MDRRLVIAIGYLVLALAALAVAGLSSPAGAPAAQGVAPLPQPAPCPMTERPQVISGLPGDAPVAWQPLAPGGMSGEFRDLRYASTAGHPAPSIYIPFDRWHFRSPSVRHMARAHRIGALAC